jgi:hypothetical protein
MRDAEAKEGIGEEKREEREQATSRGKSGNRHSAEGMEGKGEKQREKVRSKKEERE